ncbi:MAG: cysteine hydrolase family protein, partial [Streptococcus salivarius]
VLTDICVLHTAIDAYNLGYDIEVVASATASLTPEAHDFAIGHFKNVLGATIVE